MYSPPSNLNAYKPNTNIDIVVFPTLLDIPSCIAAGIITGGQFGHPDDHGAHTGDISMKMLKDAGCTYVLCGHSERRQDHGETDEFVAAQVASALKNELNPILCVGETEEERNAGKEQEIVKAQLEAVLKIPTLAPALTLAYEPVWAIGTGKTATPEDAQEMHSFIRKLLSEFRIPTSECRIIYGGSMKPENAAELLAQPDIDGGLIGGASLDPGKFEKIIEAA